MGKPILLISGYVEVTGARRNKAIKPFSGVVVSGETEEEVRRNFDYSRAFTKKEDQKKARELQSEGRVKLTNYKIEKHLGYTVY